MTPFRPVSALAALFGIALIALPALSFAQSSRVIINRGATQKASVTLRADSNVNIDPISGNVIVDCQPSASDPNECLDPIGTGGGTLPPAFSIAGSNFSQTPTAGLYPPLTTFTIAPVGLNASYEACQRISTGGGGSTNWTGLTVPGAATLSNITLPNEVSTYNFSLRCFAATGARTSNVLTYATATGGGGTLPGNCPTVWTGQPWENFTRSPTTLFTQVRNQATGGFLQDFPHINGLGVIKAGRGEILSIQFSASATIDNNGNGTLDPGDFNVLQRELNWIESQSGGSAVLSRSYMTISRCPGDLRLPPADNIPDPSEPTLNLGCRNLTLVGSSRFIVGGMGYTINGTPNNDRCALAYGQTYFLNFVTVDPLDGYQANEHNCMEQGSDGRCGVALQSQ